jgi:hypothetical protein
MEVYFGFLRKITDETISGVVRRLSESSLTEREIIQKTSISYKKVKEYLDDE